MDISWTACWALGEIGGIAASATDALAKAKADPHEDVQFVPAEAVKTVTAAVKKLAA